MKANRFAAINDSPILAHVPDCTWPDRPVSDLRYALNFHPGPCDLSGSIPIGMPNARVASYLHCDLAVFLSRQSRG